MEEMHRERYMGRAKGSHILTWHDNLSALPHVHQSGSSQIAYFRSFYGGFITGHY